MPFDIGAGLSSMGTSVAQTAGTAALELQKSNLETQKEILANQLATTRETTIEGQREQAAKDIIPLQTAAQVSAHKQETQDAADIAIAQAPKLAAVNDQIAKDRASDPEYLASLRKIGDASATVAERASAAASMAQVFNMKLQDTALQGVQAARTALQKAVDSGDTDAIRAAQQQMAVATYSAKDEVVAAATQKGVADSARLYVESIDARIARIAGSTQANTPEGKSQLAQLNGERAQAQQSYKTLQAAAVAAAQQIPNVNLGSSGVKPGAPPLGNIFGKPAPAAAPPAGLINAPSTSGLPPNTL